MRHDHGLLFLIALLAACGCGGIADEGAPDDTPAAPVEVIPMVWNDFPEAPAIDMSGEPAPDLDDELGKLEQPIWLHMPGMGTEKTNGMRCARPFGGGECQIPDRKRMVIAAYSWTCTSNWKAVMDQAINEANNNINFSVEFVRSEDAPGEEVKWEIFCHDNTGNKPPMETTIDNFWGYDCNHLAGPDYVCRYENGYTKINLTSLINNLGPVYFGHTWAQQQRFVKNGLIHELMHIAGLGHSNSVCGSVLMGACGNAADETWWNIQKSPTASEKKFLDCFNPSAAIVPDPAAIGPCP